MEFLRPPTGKTNSLIASPIMITRFLREPRRFRGRNGQQGGSRGSLNNRADVYVVTDKDIASLRRAMHLAVITLSINSPITTVARDMIPAKRETSADRDPLRNEACNPPMKPNESTTSATSTRRGEFDGRDYRERERERERKRGRHLKRSVRVVRTFADVVRGCDFQP